MKGQTRVVVPVLLAVGLMLAAFAMAGASDNPPPPSVPSLDAAANRLDALVAPNGVAAVGTVTIRKVAVGGDATFDFEWLYLDGSQTDPPDVFSITTSGGTGTFGPWYVYGPDYSWILQEIPPSGWSLTGVTCDQPNVLGAVDLVKGTAVITWPAEGINANCTFTNSSVGSITIIKDAQPPSGADRTFNGVGPGGYAVTFKLDDDGNVTLPNTWTGSNLASGSYTFTEVGPINTGGYDLTAINCSSDRTLDTPTNDPATGLVVINLKGGENVTCTFVNRERPIIRARKFEDLNRNGTRQASNPTEPYLTGWRMTVYDSAGSLVGSKDTSGANGQAQFTGLAAGQSYVVCEALQPGWSNTNPAINPTYNAPCFTTGVLDYETNTLLNFGNYRSGTIVIEKQTDPDGASGTFSFTDNIADPNSFSLSDNGTQTFLNVPVGSYQVVEDDPSPHFDLTGLTCDDGNSTGDTGTRTASIVLEQGETVRCTFTNTQRGRIVIQKEAVGGNGTFSFRGDLGHFGLTTSGGSDSRTFPHVVPGSYAVSEEDPGPAFDLTGLDCDDDDSTTRSTIDGSTSTIHVDPGETVTCTFTNTKRGTIVIVKETMGGDGTFSFTGDLGDFPLTTSGGSVSREFADVAPGSYAVSEADPGLAYALTELDCDDDASATRSTTDGSTATIGVDPGETVTCTFTNAKRGKIVIAKQTVGGDGTFNFSGDLGTFPLTTSGGSVSREFADVAPGSYAVSEADPAPAFDLTGLDCDDDASATPSTIAGSTATIEVDPDETVTCTFTNTKRGKIVIVKQTVGGDGTFGFSGDLGAFPLTTQGGGASQTFEDLVPGAYDVSEADPTPAFDLTGLDCDDDRSQTPSEEKGSTATIGLDPGETVTCTFTNTKRGTIIVEKQTLPDGDGAQFTFTGTAAGTIGDGGTIEVDNLIPGPYTSVEAVPPGWDLTDITCDDDDSRGELGTGTATFNVGPGETVRCVFTNTKRGAIIVEKQTVPDGDGAQFTFTGTAAGTIGDGGMIVVSNLVPGPYTSVEAVPPGWDLVDITCDDANSIGDKAARTATFNVEPGETVTCVFTNTRRGRIRIDKVTLPADPQTFAISIQGPRWAGKNCPAVGNGDNCNSGWVVPGSGYSATETPLPGLWDLTAPTSQIVCSNGSTAANITVDPGKTTVCTFTNVKRGKLTVIKEAYPAAAGAAKTFNFTFGGTPTYAYPPQTLPGSFSLNGGGTWVSNPLLKPGTYRVAESAPGGGWYQAGATCEEYVQVGDQLKWIVVPGPASITLGPGAQVRCTFVNKNDPPTNLALSKSNVAENKPVGTLVGYLSATDTFGDVVSFALSPVDGTAATAGNNFFQVVKAGGQWKLLTKISFDYERQKAYSIVVLATDSANNVTKKQFTLSILNVLDPT